MLVTLDDKIYNIEMNNNSSKAMLERNIDYGNMIYRTKRTVGSKYEYQYTIQFNINNFTFKGNDETIEEYYIQNEKYVLTDKIKYVFIYLPNIRKKYYNKEKLSNLERLLMVFNESNKKEAMKLARGSEIMVEYRKEAEEASDYEDMLESLTYDREEMLRCTMEIDKKREIEKAVKEATEKVTEKVTEQVTEQVTEKTIKESALNFHNNGATDELICKSLNLTIDELNELLKR